MKDFRFSHEKRLFLRTTFNEFTDVARKLVALVQKARPCTTVKVLTCEDARTYNSMRLPSHGRKFINIDRKSYTLDQLTVLVWKRSLEISLIIKENSDFGLFMVYLSCDRNADAGSIKFYGNDVDQKTYKMVMETFLKPSIVYKIGDGHRKGTKSSQIIYL